MSGIFGQVNVNTEPEETELRKMLVWNGLYGRNKQDVAKAGNAALGCCINSDLEENKDISPVLHGEKGVLAVIDALVYNRAELREKLKRSGQTDNTEKLPDNSLLFEYIQRFGFNALAEINGDFAGAVYDPQNGAVTLFRDHMGIRPLFYTASDETIAFSTDIRGLFVVNGKKAMLSEKWLYRSLSGLNQVNICETEYENVFCVRPGTCITFPGEKETVYWEPGKKKIRYRHEKEYTDRLRELITDAVKRRLDVCPGKAGAELSGGLDSSVISILIKRLGREAVYYSWSPSAEALPYVENDERCLIDEICEREGITCNYGSTGYKIREGSDLYSESVNIFGEEYIRKNGIAGYVLPPYSNTMSICETAQFMREHGAKMVFTGHGGDEGVSHRSAAFELYYHHEYLSYLKFMWKSTENTKGFVRKLRRYCISTVKNIKVGKKKTNITVVRDTGESGIINKKFALKHSGEKINPFSFAYDPLDYVKNGGVRPRLDNVALYGAYSNVRYVVPYLDYRVIDFALSIPRRLYLKREMNRYIFRQAFKDILPDSLYRLDEKQTASLASIETKKQDYSAQLDAAAEFIDREHWSQYIDFEKLDTFAKLGKDNNDGDEYNDLKKQVIMVLSAVVAAKDGINEATENINCTEETQKQLGH